MHNLGYKLSWFDSDFGFREKLLFAFLLEIYYYCVPTNHNECKLSVKISKTVNI